MALSVHRESERNDKFKLEYSKSGSTGHHYQQAFKHNSGPNTFLPATNYGSKMGISEVITSTPRISSRTMGGGSTYQHGAQVNVNGENYGSIPPFCPSYDGKISDEGNNTNPDSFYSPWSLDTSENDLGYSDMMPSHNGLDFDCQTQGLDQSSTSDRFGLNSSTSSGGFALDDLVSKILEDDQSLFAYNGLPDASANSSTQYSDLFSFNGSGNVGVNESPNNWSPMTDAFQPSKADSSPSVHPHTRLERTQSGSSSLGYGSMPRPSPASDLLWDLGAGGDSSTNNLVNEQLLMDNLYGMTTRSDHMMNDSDSSLNHSDLSLHHPRSTHSDHLLNEASDKSLNHPDLALLQQNSSASSKSHFTFSQQLFPEQRFQGVDLLSHTGSQAVTSSSMSNPSAQQLQMTHNKHHHLQQPQQQHQQHKPQQKSPQQYHNNMHSVAENHGYHNTPAYSSHSLFGREMSHPVSSVTSQSGSTHAYKPHSSSSVSHFPDASLSFTSPSSAYKLSSKTTSSAQMPSCNGMQEPSAAATLETWSNPELQQAVNLDRQLLMQALGNQLTLAQINSILNANKDATLKQTGKNGKCQDGQGHPLQMDKEAPRTHPKDGIGAISSVGNEKNLPNGMSDAGAAGRNMMQPIRVLTQQPATQAPNNQPTISTWSNPSTPNSSSEQNNTPPTGNNDATPAMIANVRLQLLHQKALQQQLAAHPPIPPLDKRFVGSSGSVRGRNPFLSRQRQFNEMELKHAAAALAAAANNERLYRANMMTEHAVDQGAFLKDVAGYPSPRSHFIEEFLPPEYAAGLPPPPPHFGKFASHLAAAQAHGSAPFHDGLDYFPAAHFDPYLHAAAAAAAVASGRMPPPFFGPNDIFFDLLPPHFYGLPPFFAGFRPPRRTGPSNELHLRLEDCYDQFKNLERERKKTEAELARQNPGKKVSSANNIVIPRLPSNPSRVDRLVVDSLREHARVVTLIQKMEKLSGEVLHANIHSAMETWMEGIRKVQARRKEEIINATNRHRNGGPRFQEEKDVLALAASIGELTTHLRRARTAMWCALNASSNDVPQLRAQFRVVDAVAATTVPTTVAVTAAAVAASAAAPPLAPVTADTTSKITGIGSTDTPNSIISKTLEPSKVKVEDVITSKGNGDDNNNCIESKVDDGKQAGVLNS